MKKFSIAIFKIPVLYEILYEIKSELNFNIFNFEENDQSFKDFISKNPQSLIVTSNKNYEYDNILYYKKSFKIKQLVQQINIFFSKYEFDIKSNIFIGDYRVDTNSRLIHKNNLSLKLTEKEIDLLVFLKKSNTECTSLSLQKNVWKHTKDLETHTVETHIYRLRKKITDCFGEANLIINNKKGYKLYK